VQNTCRCELCQRESLQQWYGRFIGVLQSAANRHGRGLAIRDFAYKPADHQPMIAAMRAAAPEVVENWGRALRHYSRNCCRRP